VPILHIPQIFRQRRSVRVFKAEAVSDTQIEKILLAASLAPTARNVQPWEFVIIKDQKKREKLATLASPNGTFLKQAPVCIAVFCQGTKYYLEDGSSATAQALLCAAAIGLGTCWVAGDKKEYAEPVREFLGTPKNYKLVSLIALGYAGEIPSTPKRPLMDMIHWNKF
jgi:nitroreductase